jgi:hypothetical protein
MVIALKQKPTSEEVVHFLAKEYTKAGSEEKLAIHWIAVYNSLRDQKFFEALRGTKGDFHNECGKTLTFLSQLSKGPERDRYQKMSKQMG